MKHRMRNGLAAAALLALLTGCAATPKSIPALEQARQELQTTRADPNAQRFASREIEEAERLLAVAEGAVKERETRSTISHLAYLSTQSSKIAREQGKAKSAEERLAQGAAERDRIRLQARTQEVEAARSETQQAQAQAAAAGTELAVERERSAQLEQEKQELMAKPSERGLVVTLRDVMFDTGKAELKSGADRQLDMIATFLSQHAERHVLIEGFTDSVGSESYNERLSERRADAVRSALLTRGVDASRIQIEGYGEQYPVGTNADTGGRQLNRRVEVIVSNGASPVEPRARL